MRKVELIKRLFTNEEIIAIDNKNRELEEENKKLKEELENTKKEFEQYKQNYNIEKDKQTIFLMTGRRY